MNKQLGRSELSFTEDLMKFVNMFLVATLVLLAGTLNAQAQSAGSRSLSEGKPVIATDPSECPNPERYVLNQDIYGLNGRFNRMIIELATSVSGEVQTILPPDRTRIDAYIAALESYRGWIISQNYMDYPGTYKLYYCLPQHPAPVYIANEQVRDIMNQTLVMQGEMYISQSSRLTSGLLPSDDERLESYLNRMRQYMITYADAANSPDYPRSTEMTRLIRGEEPR